MIRIYRLVYRVPPQYHTPVHPDIRALAKLYYENGRPIPSTTWDECQMELEAFDATEATQRLEYRLLAQGYWCAGTPGHARYELLDIVPVRALEGA